MAGADTAAQARGGGAAAAHGLVHALAGPHASVGAAPHIRPQAGYARDAQTAAAPHALALAPKFWEVPSFVPADQLLLCPLSEETPWE